TVLEPVLQAMLAGLSEVSAHFSRFPVTEIALSDRALGQFSDKPMLQAAELLAHAKVDVICWNGTSSGWLGLDSDRRLIERITHATGVRATTAVLSLVDCFRAAAVRKFALVSPYTQDIQDRIIANFRSEGFDCVAERHSSHGPWPAPARRCETRSRDLLGARGRITRDDRALALQRGDLIVGKAVVAQDGARVLAVERRAGAHCAGCLREFHRQTQRLHGAERGMLDCDNHFARHGLRICERLEHVVHRPARHATLLERREPVSRGVP